MEEQDAIWGVVVIDADHFKELNDREDHLAGGRALVLLARYLTSRVRVDDVVVRFGGDEFLILIQRDASACMPGLVQRLREGGGEAGVGFSLGWALRERNEVLERTIYRADRRLFIARRRARASRRGSDRETPGG